MQVKVCCFFCFYIRFNCILNWDESASLFYFIFLFFLDKLKLYLKYHVVMQKIILKFCILVTNKNGNEEIKKRPQKNTSITKICIKLHLLNTKQSTDLTKKKILIAVKKKHLLELQIFNAFCFVFLNLYPPF